MKRWLMLILLHSIAMLPWHWLQTLGKILGTLWVWIPNRQRRDALINIRLCLPHLSETQHLKLRHQSMVHLACTYMEFAAIWLWPTSKVLGLIREETGAELLQCQPGQGLILLSPHLGSWEIISLYRASKDRFTAMYRPQHHLDEVLLKARQRNGAALVPDNFTGVKNLLRNLLQGQSIGILPDQVTREETGSIFAPFFGIKAATMLLVARLARRSNAKVVFVFAERLPNHLGFHLHWLPAPDGIASNDDLEAATALNKGVEQCIAICPEQYQWTYRRFRRHPNQEPSPYRGPSI